jgi:perosamine synthetase
MDIKENIKNMTIHQSATIREAMRAIDRGMLGLTLICDEQDGSFMGLVTDGDLRRALLNGKGLEAPIAGVDRKSPITASISIQPDELAPGNKGARPT